MIRCSAFFLLFFVVEADRTYVTDLVLCLLHSLHLRRVGHHAETFALVLFKVLLIERLEIFFKRNSGFEIRQKTPKRCCKVDYELARTLLLNVIHTYT